MFGLTVSLAKSGNIVILLKHRLIVLCQNHNSNMQLEMLSKIQI